MLKTNIKNSLILNSLAQLGKGDVIVIGSQDFAIPEGAKFIDISLTEGIPSIEQVLESVTKDYDFTSMTVSDELGERFAELKEEIIKISGKDSPESLTFRQLKVVAKNARFVIRTGDTNEFKSLVLTV